MHFLSRMFWGAYQPRKYSVSQLGEIYRGSDVRFTLVGTWQCHVRTWHCHVPTSIEIGATMRQHLSNILPLPAVHLKFWCACQSA